jgi:nitrite reductase/ring-hydroxylating ferredoxin subunit
MAFVKVATLAEIPPGSVTEVMVEGKPVALCNVGGTVRALDGVCPHHGGPLGQGAMNGEHVTCPWHAWEFHSATGENDFDPSIRVATYAVKVEGGEIWVECHA